MLWRELATSVPLKYHSQHSPRYSDFDSLSKIQLSSGALKISGDGFTGSWALRSALERIGVLEHDAPEAVPSSVGLRPSRDGPYGVGQQLHLVSSRC